MKKAHNHILIALLSLSVIFAGCGKILYAITIENNTGFLLSIYESKSGGSFVKVGEVNPNKTIVLDDYVVDTNYELEARTETDSVVASRIFDQHRDTDLTWVIP